MEDYQGRLWLLTSRRMTILAVNAWLDRPIRSNAWRYCEIQAKLSPVAG
jgi:hypothetical protein